MFSASPLGKSLPLLLIAIGFGLLMLAFFCGPASTVRADDAGCNVSVCFGSCLGADPPAGSKVGDACPYDCPTGDAGCENCVCQVISKNGCGCLNPSGKN